MSSPPAPRTNNRLDSWKEIAAYLRKGTRTVQRWERDLGLPVHRLQHDKLGSVYAYPEELDAWWTSRRPGEVEALAAGGEGLPGQPQPATSLAVLPLRDLTREQDLGYFCEGLAEEILAALARVPGIKLASRTSASRFSTGNGTARDAARELGVKTLLEGSVRRAGEGLVRIAVQLTDTANGYELWSARYDRELTGDGALAVEEEIARLVAAALAPQDSRAYDLYLRGRSYYHAHSRRDIDCAIRLFLRATEIDPEYAPAFAGLADCWSYLYLYVEPSSLLREQADWASARALELAPELAHAHASRGLAHSLQNRDADAAAEFERAMALDPHLFEAAFFFARHSMSRGDWHRAAGLFETALGIRPDDYQAPLLAAQAYDRLGKADTARALRRKGIALAQCQLDLRPDEARALYMGAEALAALGDRDEALQWAGRAAALCPDDPLVAHHVAAVKRQIPPDPASDLWRSLA